MTVKLTFTVKLQSDYHISAGHGLATEADSALLRDADGIPVLRGTTVAGLLRDGLWRLLQLEPLRPLRACRASGSPEQGTDAYCGQFHPEPNPCPICRIFGTTQHSKHWRIHSARPVGQATVFSGSQPEQATRHIVNRVRVDPRTRRAEPHKLFTQEDGNGLEFEFTVTNKANVSELVDEAALLVAAARFVRQLGRSRRRGQGECLFALKRVENLSECPADGEAAQTYLLEYFERRWLNGQKKPSQVTPLEYELPEDAPSGTRFRLVVRIDEPLLVAERAEAGNQFESRPIIMGATVRGAFAWQAAQRHGLAPAQNPDYQKTPAYRDFVQVFIRGGVRFPYLYPAEYRNRRIYPAVPAPLDWLTCKAFPGLEAGFHGAMQAKDSPERRCPHCGEQLKAMSDFVSLESVRTCCRPEQRHEMHIRIGPESGRVLAGDLFTYVSLEAGQFFVGELTPRDADHWIRFCALTGFEVNKPFTLHLGRANRRGYGRVTAWIESFDTIKKDDPHTWLQLPIEQRVPDKDGLITLTLLTDTIVVDKWGRYAAGFGEWLSECLKLPVKVKDSFVKVRAVDGFNAHLGLPRWRDLALVAGSVAYIEKQGDWPIDWQARLSESEQQGVGLRLNEGFGQIAFNHPLYRPDGAIRESEIELPEALHLASGPQDEVFQDDWRETLDEQTANLARLCYAAPFMSVARWLHSNQNKNPKELKAQLEGLGEPDADLVQAINKGGAREASEYGERQKPNRLIQKRERLQQNKLESAERQKEGLGLIYNLLETLETKDKAYWPVGIVMLADRLAGVATGKGEQA